MEVGQDCIILRAQGRELRFPPVWGRKLALWVVGGPSHNMVCNADTARYNLLGVTREGVGYVFTYLEDGRPAALFLTREEVGSLASHLLEDRG